MSPALQPFLRTKMSSVLPSSTRRQGLPRLVTQSFLMTPHIRALLASRLLKNLSRSPMQTTRARISSLLPTTLSRRGPRRRTCLVQKLPRIPTTVTGRVTPMESASSKPGRLPLLLSVSMEPQLCLSVTSTPIPRKIRSRFSPMLVGPTSQVTATPPMSMVVARDRWTTSLQTLQHTH